MLSSGKTETMQAASVGPADVTIGDLLAFLSAHAGLPLVFFRAGQPLLPGYHVTEVKAGQFSALDCGANPESWTEIFVQLWDVNEEQRHTHMAAGKFSAIIRKVTEHVALDPTARLTFEVSDGVQPMQLYRASLPSIAGGEVHVELSPRPASCKPRDRWLAEQRKASACCGSASDTPCCGS